MRAMDMPRRAWQAGTRSVGVFVRDVGRGMLEVSHNALALVGLAAVTVAAFTLAHPELRHDVEVAALGWLQERHEERETASGNLLVSVADPTGVARATAAPVEALPREQAAVASWIARRYKVAPEPVAALVREAWSIGQRAGLDPTLILAIMAIESRFNPFAQSPVGAQGLMQVLTRVHDDKYDAFGGTHAAFDPISNLRVGVQVLKECIARAGSLHEGLRHYVGAALLEHDGGYVGRVLAEQSHLRNVADGKRVPANVTNAAARALRTAAPVPVRQGEPADPAKPGTPKTPESAPGSAPEVPAAERVALLR